MAMSLRGRVGLVATISVALAMVGCPGENDSLDACRAFVTKFNSLECLPPGAALDADASCPEVLNDTDCDFTDYYECLEDVYECDEDGLLVIGDVNDCPPPRCNSVITRDGETRNSSDSVPPKAPDRPETDILERSAQQRDASGVSQRQTSLDLCASTEPTGLVFELTMVLAGEVPESDPEWIYQYGFVLDLDGDPNNNYQAPAEFPGDFFADTDRWYVAEYSPATGWAIVVSDATNSNVVQIGSGACISIRGDIMSLRVPFDEMVAPWPRYRVTAFAHQGDFGSNPPYVWSGDVQPPVAEGLAASPGG